MGGRVGGVRGERATSVRRAQGGRVAEWNEWSLGTVEFEWVERARRANLETCVRLITRRVGCRDQTSEWVCDTLGLAKYLDRVRRGVLDLGIETGDFADEHGLRGGECGEE